MNLVLLFFVSNCILYKIISFVGAKYSGMTTILNYILYTSHLNYISKEDLLKLFLTIIHKKITVNTLELVNNTLLLNKVNFIFDNSLQLLYDETKNDIAILNYISTKFIRQLKSNKDLIVEGLICSRNIIFLERKINLRASYYLRENIYSTVDEVRDIFQREYILFMNYIRPYLFSGDYMVYTVFNNNFINEPMNDIKFILKKLTDSKYY